MKSEAGKVGRQSSVNRFPSYTFLEVRQKAWMCGAQGRKIARWKERQGLKGRRQAGRKKQHGRKETELEGEQQDKKEEQERKEGDRTGRRK
jgi:hypothetical protein